METSLKDNHKENNDLSEFMATGNVPTNMWLQHAEACKEALGPVLLSVREINVALDKARQALVRGCIEKRTRMLVYQHAWPLVYTSLSVYIYTYFYPCSVEHSKNYGWQFVPHNQNAANH